jgi:hypothetical protein
MKQKICELIGFLLIAAGFAITVLPVYWALTKNPLYLLLMFVSWIPGLLLAVIGANLYD